MHGFAITGLGRAVPNTCRTSEQIDAQLGFKLGTTLARTGIESRFTSTTETSATLGAVAAIRALQNAVTSPDEVDCLIAAYGTPDQALPFNAALLHRELGWAQDVKAFDVGASCLSFLVALEQAILRVQTGASRCVVVVSADIATFGLNWTSFESSAIFGDGAAACVVQRSDISQSSKWLAESWLTLSHLAESCKIPAGGSRFHPARLDVDSQKFLPLTHFHMEGATVFKAVRKILMPFLNATVARAGINWDDLACVIPHQASALAITHLERMLPIPCDRVVKVYQQLGNQVAASLPTALCIAHEDKKFTRGSSILLVGTGAGLTMGAMVLKW
mgnify:CR=1 FL=1